MTPGLAIAAFLVAANAFFVGSEFAIARLRHTQVAEYVRERRPGARSAQHAVEHIDAYLSACQLGITLCSLALGAVGEQAFYDLLRPIFGEEARVAGLGLASVTAFLIITVAHVVLGELAPARYRASPKRPRSMQYCATCAASSDTSRSCSTRTARSRGCSPSKTSSKSSSARSKTSSTPATDHAGGIGRELTAQARRPPGAGVTLPKMSVDTHVVMVGDRAG
jgi:Cyclin M transmembrane N-terminal domain